MAYFFSTPVDIDIVLDDDNKSRDMVDVKLDKNRREKAPLYKDGESVKGAVTVRPKDGKRLEHMGIKVQFIGTIGKPPWNRFGCAMERDDAQANRDLHAQGHNAPSSRQLWLAIALLFRSRQSCIYRTHREHS